MLCMHWLVLKTLASNCPWSLLASRHIGPQVTTGTGKLFITADCEAAG